jgi:hypothetical protein
MPRASSVNTTRAARRILYFAVGAALLSIPTLAAADETFTQQATVYLPPGSQPLTSFDISWVDASLHRYFLADRSNKSIDVVNTDSKHVRLIIPPPPYNFVGNTGNSDTSGPNGVLTIRSEHDHDHDTDDGGRAQIWAGDGNSTVKILDYPSGNVVNVISTGGTERADELCYDPRDNLVMIANDASTDLFVTFISTEGNNPILGTKLKFDGTDPNARNIASNGGIEQCQWNPRNGKIYLNLPSTTNPPNPQGTVAVIDPKTRKVVDAFAAGSTADNCQPAGMALGPDHQILLGCGPNANDVALVMFDNGSTIDIPGNSGSDEVWFNPGDGHYFLAESKHPAASGGPQLGIVDSRNDAPDQNVLGTGSSSHSVAADPERNQAYVPINGGGTSNRCGTSPTQLANGCIAIFGPSGRDDRLVFRDHDHDHD